MHIFGLVDIKEPITFRKGEIIFFFINNINTDGSSLKTMSKSVENTYESKSRSLVM